MIFFHFPWDNDLMLLNNLCKAYDTHNKWNLMIYNLVFVRLNILCTMVPTLFRSFLSFCVDFKPILSFLRICLINEWKTSSTNCLNAAEVSKNGQSNSCAKACPSSVVTSLLLSKSVLFATRTIGISSDLRNRSICFLACDTSRKLCLSVMEYIMTNPSPLRMYCSLIAVNSCCKIIGNMDS